MHEVRDHAIGIAGGAVFFATTAIAQPFFSLYAQSLGASTATIGLLVTGRALVPMFMAMPVGQLIDLVGARVMVRLGFVLLVLSLALTAASKQIGVLALAQMLLGASIIITASALQVLVSRGEEGARNRNINRYSMAMSAGGMVGPLLGGALVSGGGGGIAGYRFAFAVATGASILAVLLLQVATRRRAGSASESSADGSASDREGRGRLRLVRDSIRPREIVRSYAEGFTLTRHRGVQFGLAGTFLIMFIQVLTMSFVPLFLHSAGYGAWVISAMVSLNGLAGIVSRIFLNSFVKRLGLERLLILAGCVAAASLIVIPLAIASLVLFALLTIMMGSATGMNLPVSIMIMVNVTAESERGKLMGLRLLVNRISQMASPAIFGVLGESLGLGDAFFAGGAFLLATMVGFAAVARARPGRQGPAEVPPEDAARREGRTRTSPPGAQA